MNTASLSRRASPMSVLLALALGVAVAAGETPCQICCSPGGDCSKASHGNPGVCCGVKNGLGMCCPAVGAKCWTCSNEYRCYTGSRPPPNICGAGSGSRSGGGVDGDVAAFTSSLVGIMAMVLIAFSIYQCMRSRSIPLAQQQGIAMAPVQPYGLPMAKPGQPIGQPCAGMPVASAYPASQCYPQGYPAHGYPQQAYPCQAGCASLRAGNQARARPSPLFPPPRPPHHFCGPCAVTQMEAAQSQWVRGWASWGA